MNTAKIYLFREELDWALDCDQVTVSSRKSNGGVSLSVKADEETHLVTLSFTSDEAQALIESLQAALNAHWGNV